MEPVLLKGGETVKSLSTAFLADLEEDWRAHGKKVFPVLREWSRCCSRAGRR